MKNVWARRCGPLLEKMPVKERLEGGKRAEPFVRGMLAISLLVARIPEVRCGKGLAFFVAAHAVLLLVGERSGLALEILPAAGILTQADQSGKSFLDIPVRWTELHSSHHHSRTMPAPSPSCGSLPSRATPFASTRGTSYESHTCDGIKGGVLLAKYRSWNYPQGES